LRPSYWPQRNLIERLGQVRRQNMINPGFCRTKGPFRTAGRGFFDRRAEFEHELAPLLTPTFHRLDSQNTSAQV
jgi:hypothetical protein